MSIETKPSFSLSRTNKTYFLIVMVLGIAFFAAFSDKNSYQFGRLAGSLFGLLLWSSLIAWIVWRIRGRKEKGGNITFNVVMTLALLGQLGQLGNKAQQNQEINAIAQHEIDFKKELLNTDDPAAAEDAYKKYAGSVKDGIDRLSKTATGENSEFYKIMGLFVSDSQILVQKWLASCTAVQSPDILDYSLLKNDGEFERQSDIVKVYVEETKVYRDNVAAMIPRLKKRLSVLGADSEIAKGAINGANKRYGKEKPVFEPLMQMHIDYGNSIVQILVLLHKNKDQWEYKDDELLINNDDVLDDYNELIEAIGNYEVKINELSEKLAKTM